jgi:hypothetical protein
MLGATVRFCYDGDRIIGDCRDGVIKAMIKI